MAWRDINLLLDPSDPYANTIIDVQPYNDRPGGFYSMEEGTTFSTLDPIAEGTLLDQLAGNII